jgi:aminocarboxymuconate-semialdehyde decarboxylase
MRRREFIAALSAAPLAFTRRAKASRRRDGGPVIDLHAHYFPESWLKLVESEGERDGMKLTRTQAGGLQFTSDKLSLASPPEIAATLESRVRAMDQRGIDIQVLSLTSPMVNWASPDLGARLSRAFNDAASAGCRAYPKRFLFAAALPVQAPDLALQELARAAQLPGMRAVYFPTSYGGKEIDDKSLWPIYAQCEQHGWPVLLHPSETIGRERTSRSWGLDNLAGNPYDTGIATAHLIFGGVLDAFPKLTVMLPHAGGTVPAVIGRWDRGVEVRPELKDFKKPASSYLRRFLFDIIAHNDQILLNLIHMVGANRVVLGDDYPFNMGLDRPVEVVESLKGLSAKEKDSILGGNAAALLKVT